jgi:hypothetical protein
MRIVEFGLRGELRERLVAAVLSGAKTATTGLLVEWELDSESSAATPSEPELANARLVEAEVVAHLVTYRLDDVCPQALGIVPKVAHERVAEDQDLVWQATAAEERGTAQPGADVHTVRVVLGTAVGNDDRHVLERSLELERELVER